MLDEIDKDFYCSAHLFTNDPTTNNQCAGKKPCSDLNCAARHRKHPTPEQYKEEYGVDWPDNASVYWLDKEDKKWRVTLHHLQKKVRKEEPFVCACTPFGKPGNNWRPQ